MATPGCEPAPAAESTSTATHPTCESCASRPHVSSNDGGAVAGSNELDFNCGHEGWGLANDRSRGEAPRLGVLGGQTYKVPVSCVEHGTGVG